MIAHYSRRGLGRQLRNLPTDPESYEIGNIPGPLHRRVEVAICTSPSIAYVPGVFDKIHEDGRIEHDDGDQAQRLALNVLDLDGKAEEGDWLGTIRMRLTDAEWVEIGAQWLTDSHVRDFAVLEVVP